MYTYLSVKVGLHGHARGVSVGEKLRQGKIRHPESFRTPTQLIPAKNPHEPALCLYEGVQIANFTSEDARRFRRSRKVAL